MDDFCLLTVAYAVNTGRVKLIELMQYCDIPAKSLHNDIVSVHFNHFLCMGICNKLSRHLSMLTYIYRNVDEC